MTSPQFTYWVSRLTPLVILAALAFFLLVVLADHCELVGERGYLVECSLK